MHMYLLVKAGLRHLELRTIRITVDQFNKKRVLLPQTPDYFLFGYAWQYQIC